MDKQEQIKDSTQMATINSSGDSSMKDCSSHCGASGSADDIGPGSSPIDEEKPGVCEVDQKDANESCEIRNEGSGEAKGDAVSVSDKREGVFKENVPRGPGAINDTDVDPATINTKNPSCTESTVTEAGDTDGATAGTSMDADCQKTKKTGNDDVNASNKNNSGGRTKNPGDKKDFENKSKDTNGDKGY